MLQKLSADNNAINWFEIPVTNTVRAKQFYETILDIVMLSQKIEETGDEMVLFPRTPDTVMALSGKVSGTLLKSEKSIPSKEGGLIYLNASPFIQTVIDKIVPAGGNVVLPKTKIPAGYISIFIDTEGNKVGLHAEA